MEAIWIAISVLFATLAVVQAVLVAAQAYEHRRFTRSRLRCLDSYRPNGRTVLLVPCRGHDLGLAQNLASLFEQDYDDYEIRFLVETPDDPVCRTIHRVALQYPDRLSRIVFAGKATDCGQKVHNLLRGTEQLPRDIKYLAFADSDARPRPEWLRALIHRLSNDRIGATTGYRWFVPMRTTTPNLLVTSVNASLGMLAWERQSEYHLGWFMGHSTRSFRRSRNPPSLEAETQRRRRCHTYPAAGTAADRV